MKPAAPANGKNTGYAVNYVKAALSDVWRLARHPRQGLRSLYGVSLYRNAFNLMAGMAITSMMGFFFWIMAARFYPVEAVGVGSAAIAALGLLAILSELGLGVTMVRFLPGADNQGNDIINNCFTMNGLASMAIALIFLAGLHIWSPALLSIRQHPIVFAAFIVFTVGAGLQPLVHHAFMAKLNTRLIVIKAAIDATSRIALGVIFAGFLSDAFGILAATGLATAIGILVAVFLLLPSVQKGYRLRPKLTRVILNKVSGYAVGNYVPGVLLQIAPLALPLMVLNLLGAEMNAYFYIAWTVAVAFRVIPSSAFNSLFAEGSNDEGSLRTNVAKSLKLMLLLLLPLTLLVLIAGEWLLQLFGQTYADNAAVVLRIVIVAVIPYGINYLYISIERVRKNLRGIVATTAAATCLSLGLSYLLMRSMGVAGAGVGYAAGQTIVAVAVGINLWRRYYPRATPQSDWE